MDHQTDEQIGLAAAPRVDPRSEPARQRRAQGARAVELDQQQVHRPTRVAGAEFAVMPSSTLRSPHLRLTVGPCARLAWAAASRGVDRS